MFHVFNRRIVSVLLLAISFILLPFPRLLSQAFVNGAIVGTVTDSAGAALADVNVTLTSLDTGSKLATQSNSTGLYRFLDVPPGRYRVEAEKTGFRKFTQEPITILVNNTVKLDVGLKVGAVSESVVVTGEPPSIQPETSSLGEVIETRAVNELPLNGRNPMALVALVPGVVPQGGFGTTSVGQNIFAVGNVQINGGEANQSASYWDGAPLMAIGYDNLQAFAPTQDALQEFKVMTDAMPAQYDRFAGGIVSFTTKTGTNALHGEGYEYIRNKVLNTNDYFNNQNGLPNPQFTQNQFGGNLGGPVVLPHLYHGKDRSFFFFSYDGFRIRQGLPLQFTVPTDDERKGDFTNYRDNDGNMIPIYDPSLPVDPVTGDRQQISCNGVLNKICDGLIDLTAKALIPLWGEPNTKSLTPANLNNWVGNASNGGNTDQYTGRVDLNLGEKQRMFVRYTRNNLVDLTVDPWHNNTYPLSIGDPQTATMQQTVINDAYTITPKVIADVNLGYLRESLVQIPGSYGIDLTQYGPAWAALNSVFPIHVYPQVNLADFMTSFGSTQTGLVILDHTDDWSLRPNLTVAWGRHTMTFGVDFWPSRYNYYQNNTPTGIFTFTDNMTSQNPATAVGGLAFASFLLGDMNSGGAGIGNQTAAQVIYRAYYAQDDFKVNRKLTLNLGLRYDQEGPFSERFNRQSTFLTDAPSPLAALTGLPLKGALVLVDTPAWPSRNPYKPNNNQWAPRFGFGYEINAKTAVRGGYGIYFLPPGSAGAEAPAGDPINYGSANSHATVNNAGALPEDRLSNPFPSGVVQPPGRNPSYEYLLRGTGLWTTLANTPFPGYAQQWNLDVQREMPGQVFVDVAYAGAKGTHLPGYGNINQLDPKYFSMGMGLTASMPNPFANYVPATSPLAGPTISAGQLLLPYPQYVGVDPTFAIANSQYNSMQMKVTKRFTGGQQILASYTFSKTMSDAATLTSWMEGAGDALGAQNYYDMKTERSLATFDVSQRLVVSYVLEVPLGHGKRWLSGGNKLANGAVSGWGVQGISTFQKGFPVFLSAPSLNQGFGGGMGWQGGGYERPNWDTTACPTRNAKMPGSHEKKAAEWFNTACFSQPPAFSFGNVSRTLGNVRTDGIVNSDLAIFKNTAFGPEGRANFEFKAEFFNLFNRPHFGYPDQGCCSANNPDFGHAYGAGARLAQFGAKIAF